MTDLYQGMLLNNEIWKYGNQEYHFYSQEYFGVDTWSFVDFPLTIDLVESLQLFVRL